MTKSVSRGPDLLHGPVFSNMTRFFLPIMLPVETPSDEAEPLIPPSDAMGSMDADEAAARVDEGVHLREVDVPGFHDAEVRADVEAPDVTSDSLGTGLEAILARRSA